MLESIARVDKGACIWAT